MEANLHTRIESYLRDSIPEWHIATVSHLRLISSGWESDIYALDLEPVLPEPLVLRLYNGRPAATKARREFEGLKRLYQRGYPVPRVYHLEVDPRPLGKPLVIMERIEGPLLADLWLSASQERRGEMLTTFCQLLVQLHQLDWREFATESSCVDLQKPLYLIESELQSRREILAAHPIDGLAPVIDWLDERKHRVPCHRPVPIHWDFHPYNILVRGDGSPVVIDWTQFTVSDARFDLAWALLLAATHIHPDVRESILRTYERLADRQVQEIAFFEVYACLKRLHTVAVSYVYGPGTLGMRPDALRTIASHMPAFRLVYALMLDHTGIAVPKIEEWLTAGA